MLLATVLAIIGVSQWLILRNVLYQTMAHTLKASAGVLTSFARRVLIDRLISQNLPTTAPGVHILHITQVLNHRIFSHLKAPGTQIVVADLKGHVVLRSPGLPTTPPLTPSASFYLWNRRLVITEALGRGKLALGHLWIMASVTAMKHILIADTEIFGLVCLTVLVMFAILGTWSVRNSLTPLGPVVDNTLKIASGEYGHTVPVPTEPSELRELSQAVNTMSVRIHQAFAKERAISEQMRRFVADASHELRTPLTAINGFLELIGTGELSPAETSHGLKAIRRESQRMARLVNQLLALSRLDNAPQHQVQLAPIDVGQWIAELRPALAAIGPLHPLIVGEEGAMPSPPAVEIFADRDRLSEMLLNLVDNAVRHTPPGTPIHIDWGTAHAFGWIRMRDEGPGFPEDALDRVFHRFFRGDRARSGGGSGLGLSIVEGLAKGQGGRAEAGNVPPPDHGAVVTLYFPLVGTDGDLGTVK